MRRLLFLLLCMGLFLPGLLVSDTLYLKDGSIFKGVLIRVTGDTVYLETSFGSEIRVPKADVRRIDFVDSLEVPVPEGRAVVPVSSDPGTLMVTFEDFKVTSKIVMKRGRDEEGHERENSIEQALMISERKVYSVIDSTTDKVIKEGPDTKLRNDMKPVDFRVVLPSGLHHCTLVFANSRVAEYGDRFDPRPLERRLDMENINIEPGETYLVRIGSKRKKWGLSKGVLYRVD